MKHFLITVAGVLVGGFILLLLPLFFIIMIGGIASTFSSNEAEISKNTILVYNLETSVPDYITNDPMAAFNNAIMGKKNEEVTLRKLQNAIQYATTDENISCLVLKGTTSGASYANMNSIQQYLKDFKATGKPIYFFDNSIDQSAMYLASNADSIFVVPTGTVLMYGLTSTRTFYKNAFDKFGIDMQIIRHGKYKSAVEPYMTDHMSEASREQTQKYLDAIWNNMREEIASNRKIDSERIDNYVNKLNFAELQSAVDIHLIDRCIYRDEFLAMLKQQVGIEPDEDLKTISIEKYSNSVVSDNISDNQIAVIYAQGEIYDGTANGDQTNIYGDDLARTIRKARTDENIKAIVLRVNSPGGSALASDVIWREVKLASETKPTVVSMGQYAASGGYYISCAANYIFAEPTTITGSIGIFGMIPCAKKAANNLGFTFDSVSTSEEGEPTLFEPLSEGWQNMLQNRIEAGYQTFISRCANGRHTTTEHIDSIGQGRVWAGVDAMNIGLVDYLGSLETAIEYAAQLSHIDDYVVTELPQADDSFMALMKQLGMNTRASIGRSLFGQSFEEIQKVEKMIEKPSINARMEYDITIY